MPNLHIAAIRITPSPTAVGGREVIIRGQEYSFALDISNTGHAVVPGTVAVRMDYGCKGPGVGRSNVLAFANGPVGLGQSVSITQPYLVTIPSHSAAGSCEFTFTVDPDGVYAAHHRERRLRRVVDVH